VVALPKSSALGGSTKSLPRNTLFGLARAKLFGLHRDIAAALAAVSRATLDPCDPTY